MKRSTKSYISILVLLFSLICFAGMAQQTENQDYTTQASESQTPKVNVNLGSTVFTDFSGHTGFASWITPTFSKPITKKFSMAFSTSFMQGYNMPMYTLNPEDGGIQMQSSNISTTTVSLSGIYAVSPKLTLMTSGYKQFQNSPLLQEANPRAIDFSGEGISIGFNYKVNDRFQINGAIDYSRGYNPRHYRNAFYNDPFSPFIAW